MVDVVLHYTFCLLSALTSAETVAPSMRELANRVAVIIPHKWKQVAIQLELDRGVRKAIEKDEKECFDQFTAVLEEWKQSESRPYTWQTLISLLKSASVGEKTLAEQLERDFC